MRLGPLPLRSLRLRAVAVIVAVTVAPVALVALASGLEGLTADDLVVTSAAAADRIAAAADPLGAAREEAAQARAWVRVVDDAGAVLVDVNADAGHENVGLIDGFFFGPEGPPRLGSWETDRPPLLGRRAVRLALAHGSASGCVPDPGAPLLVCYGAARLSVEGTTAVALVEQSRPRAIRALYDLRYQLLKLTLLVLPGALLLAWWLGWRMVRPVETLRRRVEQHLDGGGKPQDWLRRNDEFGDLAQAFSTLLARIEERGKQNEAFVADLAHEFKNPVAAIRAAAESLERGAVDEQRARRLSRILRDSSVRLDGLVTALLDLARAEAGMVGEERAPVDLGELMRRLVDVASEDERHEGVAFAIDVMGDATVEGVPGRLETAARNLVENAASYAKDGGGHVKVVVRRDRDHVVLEVGDDGPGIAAEDEPRVFERFFTTRSEGRGTGLGLALVKAVMEAHGGTVDVTSNLGEGATFRARLPRSPR